jgi:uncharacterized protein (DUF2236 family)
MQDLSIAHRVNAERVVVLGWPRAILMQMAHPLIAAGVADHSSFRDGPVASAQRLHATVHAMLMILFGDAGERERTIEGIRAIHRRVNGALRESVGGFPAGTRYSAEDPALLRWVHLTLLESVPLIYERIVRPLAPHERDAYCRESAWAPIALGAREDEIPTTWNEAMRAIEEMLASGTLAIGTDARAIAAALMRPPLSALIWPVRRLQQRITIGTLPPTLRTAYGVTDEAPDLDRTFRRLRRIRRALPDGIAQWRIARREGSSLGA